MAIKGSVENSLCPRPLFLDSVTGQAWNRASDLSFTPVDREGLDGKWAVYGEKEEERGGFKWR